MSIQFKVGCYIVKSGQHDSIDRLVQLIPMESPPGKISSILLLYDRIREDNHPVTVSNSVSYYSKDVCRLVCYTVKVPPTIEQLKQELRASLKSGRRYEIENDCIATSFTDH